MSIACHPHGQVCANATVPFARAMSEHATMPAIAETDERSMCGLLFCIVHTRKAAAGSIESREDGRILLDAAGGGPDTFPGIGEGHMKRSLNSAALLVLACFPAAFGSPEPSAAPAVRNLLDEARWSEAEVRARENLAAVTRAKGAESVEVASALDELVEALWRGGKASGPEAIQMAQRAVGIKERAL